ncbi:MAG TPA: PilZ domain-containing protein [Candidatus Acidoferrales bacterium]|nr:PilZ domain-containing protein [Candidatus Acidoferrales bacterium]
MSDRRFAQRFDVRVPIHYRAWNSPSEFVEAITTNVSERGLYLLTNESLKIGSPIQIRIRMPEAITGSPEAEWDCAAMVVRVHPGLAFGQPYGVGVKISYYEVTRAETEQSFAAASR